MIRSLLRAPLTPREDACFGQVPTPLRDFSALEGLSRSMERAVKNSMVLFGAAA